jgi:NAD(P)-dependent dehydrogenase (short-subunit alcohol dehydrogenase family)
MWFDMISERWYKVNKDWNSMTKTVLITGGSRGIGAATALLAAERGYDVCISYVSNETAAHDTIQHIESLGRKALAVRADVSLEPDILNLFETVDKTFGGLDALVNNAGILDKQTTVENLSAERLQRVFTTNVIGSFLCAREAVKRMSTKRGGKGGAIVNNSSAAARLGAPNEYVDYAASKAALDTLTFGLAKEVADQGIRVNAVRPGIIKTDIHALGGEPNRPQRLAEFIPMKRSGEAYEVATAILWLLSDEASYITGTLLDIAGGR